MIASGHQSGVVSASSVSSESAKVKYRAGDVVVAADPIVHVLNPELRGQRCDNCLIKRDKLKRCAGCSLYQYCDRKCQVTDWKAYHKNGECDFYRKLMTSSKKDVTDLFKWNHYASVLLRLFLLVKAKRDLMSLKFPLHDGGERSVNDLMDNEHDEDRSGMNPLKFHLIYSALSQIDNQLVPLSEFGILKSLFHKLRINSFSIDHMDERTGIGHAMYIHTSVFDHSCRSNAAYVFVGKRMQIRAMRDIREGEEVTIHYVDIMETKDQRRDKLWKNWGFVCQCQRCQEDESEEERMELAADKQFQNSLSPANTSHLSERERNDVTFRELVRVLPFKEKYLGNFHPELTHIMYVAANAKCPDPDMSPQDRRDFVMLIDKLKQAAVVTHGKEHEFYFMNPILRGTAGLSFL